MKIYALLAFLVIINLSVVSCKAQEEKTEVTLVSVEEAKNILAEEPGAVFLDVRTPEEFEEGHIEGAVNINFFDEDFKEQVEALDKEKPVYIYCRSGNRSQKAGKILSQMGFEKVYDIGAGYINWD